MNKYKLLLIALCLVIPAVLAACDAGGGAPQQFTLHTVYGTGPNGMGITFADPYTYLAIGPGYDCPTFNPFNQSTDANGNLVVPVPSCGTVTTTIFRGASYTGPQHCKAGNPAGGGNGYGYQYPFFTYSQGMTYSLPCGQDNIFASIVPGSVALYSYTPLTMTSLAGDFDPSGGPPMAFYYDDWGNILGQQSVWSTAPDGSSAYFASDPIMNTGTTGLFYVTILNTSGGEAVGGGASATVGVYDPNAPVDPPDPGPNPIPCNECLEPN